MNIKQKRRVLQIKALNVKLEEVCRKAAKSLDLSSCKVDIVHKKVNGYESN